MLWLFRLRITNILPVRVRDFCVYVGSHTMWIYLWHIPFVSVVEEIDNVFVRYIIVYGLSIGITAIQRKLVNVISFNIKNERIGKNVSMIFVG